MTEHDSTLLEAARQMQQEALIKIFDLYARPLYRYALRLCSDPVMADQIVGDVFARLLDHLATGKGPTANLRSYLYEIAYHLFVDEIRYVHRITPLEVLTVSAPYGGPDDGPASFRNVENRVMMETILRAIRNDLTHDQRHVIILRFLEGFSLQETAKIVGKQVTNIKVIQNRAIAALRQALGAQLPAIPDTSLRAENRPSVAS